MSSGGEGDTAWDASFPGPDAAWLEELREKAERRVRECRLPPDMTDEIAQRAAVALWHPMIDEERAVGDAEAEEAVAEEAQAERRAKRAEARYVAQAGAVTDPVRPCVVLCRTLGELAKFHPRPREFESRLRAAALAVAEGGDVLTGDRFRLFHLTWIRLFPLDDIRRAARLPRTKRDALRRRLRRISDKLEQRLIHLLAPHLSGWHSTGLRAAREERSWSGVPTVREIAISVSEALRVVLGSRG